MYRTHRHPTRRPAALLLALVVTMLVAASPAVAADDSVGFGVSPLRFDVETRAGSSSSHPITITNTNPSATTFTFSKEDFEGDKQDPAATPVMMGGKFASDISGYDWIDAPESITIPPGQSRTVNVKVNVPAGATGAHYAAVVVTGGTRSSGDMTFESRLGVLFLMNAGGAPPPDIVVTEVKEVGPTKTVTRFVNNGTTPVKDTTGTLNRDPRGPGKPTKIPGKCTKYVMPGAAGTCEFDTSEDTDAGVLPVGPVDQWVDVVGNPGEEGTAARGDLPTEWAGAWSSMLLPLVGVALFVLYFLFLRRRRKDEEDDGVEALASDGYTFS